MIRRQLGVIFLVLFGVHGFAPNGGRWPHAGQCDLRINQLSEKDSPTELNEQKKKGGLDGNVRSKLLSESIAPWRALRLFLYGALGSGAFIGGLINGSGAIAGSANPDFDLNTELLNLGIDFGAVAVFAALAKFDVDKQTELQEKVDEKMELKREQKKVKEGMKVREQTLRTLPLEITISTDGATREAIVRELQDGAKQHMIIVAGPKKACRDALVGANLLKMDFAMSNVLVVPYETDVDEAELQARPSGGFGDRPVYETQPYIAKASGEGWEDFIASEMADAVKQNGQKAKDEGIAIVVANNGNIVRRGVGTVPWRQMVEQLDEEINPSSGSIPWI